MQHSLPTTKVSAVT